MDIARQNDNCIIIIILEKEIETQDDFTSKVENNPQ